jgi:hypothetical protein
MANSYMNAEQTFHKLLHENWQSVLVIRNHFPDSKSELKETQTWGEWCRQNVGSMYGAYDYSNMWGPEDGQWFACKTSEEVQSTTGILYALAFKKAEDLMMFKLKFGIV